MSDDYSPIYIGDTGNALRATFTDHHKQAYDLSQVTGFILSLGNEDTDASITGTGSWTVVNAAQGIAQYAWGNADVSTAGMYDLYVTVTFPAGPVTFTSSKPLEIRSK